MEGSWEGRKCKTSPGSVESVCFCHYVSPVLREVDSRPKEGRIFCVTHGCLLLRGSVCFEAK